MNTIKRAQIYSAALKKYYGLGTHESPDLAVPHMRHLLKRFCT